MGEKTSVGLDAYRTLYEHSPDGIMFSSPDGAIVAANAAACAMLGMSEEQICALGRDGIADTEDPRWAMRIAERKRAGEVTGNARLRRGDGKLVDLEMTTALFQDSDGTVRLFTILRDVADRAAKDHEIEHLQALVRELTLRDELTGLSNRRGLTVAGSQLLELADRRGEDVQALFVEVQNIEEICDCFGYQAGEIALQAVARALAVTFRKSDVLSRIGDSAFQALATDLHETQRPGVEERIGDHLCATETTVVVGMPVVVSFGWCTRTPGEATHLGELIARADRAANDARRKSGAGHHPHSGRRAVQDRVLQR